MRNEVDVIIIGSDLCSIITANLLSKNGYRVVLIDNAGRLGGNYYYLPISLKLVHTLGINPHNTTIVKRIIDKLMMCFNFGRGTIHSLLNFKIAILDVRNLCEFFARDMDVTFYLWSQVKIVKQTLDNVYVNLTSPTGVTELSSRLLIQNSPPSGEFTLTVSTGYINNPEPSDSLIIDNSGIDLYLSSGRLVTGILTTSKRSFSSYVSTAVVPWGPTKHFSKSPVMNLGQSAGHSVPPWIGDYLVNSALLAYKISLAFLEDKEDESVLMQYLNFLSLIEMCKTLYNYATSGKIDELPASFVNEALKPPQEFAI